MRDQVADVWSAREAEQQVAGDPRQPHPLGELGDEHRGHERKPECQRDDASNRWLAGAGALHDGHQEQHDRQAERPSHHSSGGAGSATNATASEMSVPSATAVATAAAVGVALTSRKLIARAMPSRPGGTR